MAGCDEQVFSGVRAEHVAQFLEKGAQFGVSGLDGAGNSGEASHSGFSLRWHYDPEAGTLAVQCTKSPMFVPCSLVNSKIKQALDSVLASSGTQKA